jgi:hypothetical protein
MAETAVADAKHPMSSKEIVVMHNGVSALNRRTKNLIQMSEALSGTEARQVLMVVDRANESGGAVSAFLTLALLYRTMTGATDKQNVLELLSPELEFTRSALKADIEILNSALLPGHLNPAALSEAMAIRDKLQEFRAELDNVSY